MGLAAFTSIFMISGATSHMMPTDKESGKMVKRRLPRPDGAESKLESKITLGRNKRCTMKLTSFWLVVKPSPESTLGDICFCVDIRGLYLQFLGGLSPDDIIAVYDNRAAAEERARRELHLARRKTK
jgi:hypothetical protein